MKKFIEGVIEVIYYTLITCVIIALMFVCTLAPRIYFETQEINNKIEEMESTNATLMSSLISIRKDDIAKINIEVEKLKDVIKDEQIYVDNILEEINRKPSYEYLSSVTVRLEYHPKIYEDYGWIGTGSIVKITDDYTYILTNKHVAPMGKVMFVVKGEEEYRGIVVKNDKNFDLSLVQVVGKIPTKIAIKKIDSVNPTDMVYSVGMYRGLDFIYTQGTVAGEYTDSEGNHSDIANMPCAGGCSGSGVFDKDGSLVAVVHAGFRDGYFAMDNAKSILVPSEAIKKFLEGIL